MMLKEKSVVKVVCPEELGANLYESRFQWILDQYASGTHHLLDLFLDDGFVELILQEEKSAHKRYKVTVVPMEQFESNDELEKVMEDCKMFMIRNISVTEDYRSQVIPHYIVIM